MAKQLATRENIYDELTVVKNGTTYTLNEHWAISDNGNYDFRTKSEDKAFVHGGYSLGDNKVKSRTITLEFSRAGATEQDFNEAVNEAYVYLSQKDYELYAGRADRKYKVNSCQKMKLKYEKGFKNRRAEITVTLVLADVPFRMATRATTTEFSFDEAVSMQEITFTNGGSVDAPLKITITPAEDTTLADFRLTHSETGENMRMTDNLLTAPAVAVVNGEQGTVRRGTDNSINTFAGIFLHALPGLNHYTLTTDGAVKITIEFTARYFV